MNLGDSKLFKSFAKPTLQNYRNNARDSDSESHVPVRQTSTMDSIIQYLLNRSRLDVSLIKITEATENSYVITIESRVTGTGPISSTVSAMELDLTFGGTCFGKLDLPEVKTSVWGAKVPLESQIVRILDMTAYKAFVRSLMLNDETSFQLKNGTCTVRALGITAHCNYCLDIPLRGMMGPQVTLKMAERDGEKIIIIATIHNPSPVEVDHGPSTFDLKNMKGSSMVELTGDLRIVRGDFDITLYGRPRKGVEATDKVRLVGLGVVGNTWCQETIQYFDVVVDLHAEIAALFPPAIEFR